MTVVNYHPVSVFCFDSDRNLVRMLEIKVPDGEDFRQSLSAIISDEIVFLGYLEMPLSKAKKLDNLYRHFTFFTTHQVFSISLRPMTSNV